MSSQRLTLTNVNVIPQTQENNQDRYDNNLELPPLVFGDNQTDMNQVELENEDYQVFDDNWNYFLNSHPINFNLTNRAQNQRRNADIRSLRNRNLLNFHIFEDDIFDNVHRRQANIQPMSLDSFEKFEFNAFQVKMAHGQMCIICNRPIKEVAVKDLNTMAMYHTGCYIPPYKIQIRQIDFQYIALKPEEKISFQQNFLSRYNWQFPIQIDKFAQIQENWLDRLENENEQSLNIRSYIQIFKYFSAQEVYSIFSKVNKQWYQVTWSIDIMHHFLSKTYEKSVVDKMKKEFVPQLQGEISSQQKILKATLIALVLQSCFNCKSLMLQPEICPILQKLICKDCRSILPQDKPGTSAFVLLTRLQAMEIFNFLENDFGKSWLDDNKEVLQVYDNGHQTLVYEHFINKMFSSKRKQRKIRLMEIIESLDLKKGEKEQLCSLEIDRMYTIKIDQQRKHVLKPIIDFVFRSEKFQAAYDFIFKGICDFQALIDFIGSKSTFIKKRKLN